MKTTTTIKAFAYPVIIKDHRTGEKFEDVIVLPKEWLQICGSEGLNLCNDEHMIYRAYNLKGFQVVQIGKRRKVQLTVDLEELYAAQLRESITDREFINLTETQGASACDAE